MVDFLLSLGGAFLILYVIDQIEKKKEKTQEIISMDNDPLLISPDAVKAHFFENYFKVSRRADDDFKLMISSLKEKVTIPVAIHQGIEGIPEEGYGRSMVSAEPRRIRLEEIEYGFSDSGKLVSFKRKYTEKSISRSTPLTIQLNEQFIRPEYEQIYEEETDRSFEREEVVLSYLGSTDNQIKLVDGECYLNGVFLEDAEKRDDRYEVKPLDRAREDVELTRRFRKKRER